MQTKVTCFKWTLDAPACLCPVTGGSHFQTIRPVSLRLGRRSSVVSCTSEVSVKKEPLGYKQMLGDVVNTVDCKKYAGIITCYYYYHICFKGTNVQKWATCTQKQSSWVDDSKGYRENISVWFWGWAAVHQIHTERAKLFPSYIHTLVLSQLQPVSINCCPCLHICDVSCNVNWVGPTHLYPPVLLHPKLSCWPALPIRKLCSFLHLRLLLLRNFPNTAEIWPSTFSQIHQVRLEATLLILTCQLLALLSILWGPRLQNACFPNLASQWVALFSVRPKRRLWYSVLKFVMNNTCPRRHNLKHAFKVLHVPLKVKRLFYQKDIRTLSVVCFVKVDIWGIDENIFMSQVISLVFLSNRWCSMKSS